MESKVEKRLTRSSLANTTILPNQLNKNEETVSTNQASNSLSVNIQVRQSARRSISNNLIIQQPENADSSPLSTIKSDDKLLNNLKTRSKQSLPPNIAPVITNNDPNDINHILTTTTTTTSTSNVQESSGIKNLKKKSATIVLNHLKGDSLSASLNSAIINKSGSTSNIVTRKRHMSFSTDLNKLSSNIDNLDNLNEDSNSSSNLNLNASSSNLAESFSTHSKRFKFKFRDYDPTFDSCASSLSTLNSATNQLDSNGTVAEAEEEEQFCPVEGCDSSGHLDGTSNRHFSYDTCPNYFGMTNDECKMRKEEIEKNCADYKSKINQINENRKNLRNKQPTESQLNYFQLLKTKLKEKIKPNEQTLKSHLCDRLLGNTELLTDIKNITTSTLLNSMSIGINPTTSHASTSSSLAASKLIKSNLIYSCFNNKSITPSLVEDLNVSKFELDLFKDALVSSANSKEDKVKKLSLLNKNHKLIQFGNFEIETWYNSPYPDDYWQLDKIFICQYCLIYMKSHSTLNRHLEKCLWRHPPGREIYRKDKLSFFEVDGKFNKAYCQNLCLLAKLFLDHKTLYYDVEPFLFYVLTKYNEKNGSFEMVGYFSKEKQSVMNYNLSCILILPPFMNKSYGRLLIDFSYLLSRVEEKYGSPERPLSDLGLISYRNYWKTVILNYLSRYMNEPEISIKEASLETGIISNDIISTLQYIGLIKYWKGKHVLLKDNELIDKYVQKLNSSDNKLDPNCLKWTPYVWQTIINESDTPALSVFGKNRKN